MPFTTLELFRLLCSDLALEPNDRVNDFLEVASTFLDAAAFGGQFQRASVYYAGHLMLRSPDGGGADPDAPGSTTSKKTGDESLGFNLILPTTGMTLVDIDLMGTTYGQLFLSIRNTRAVTAPGFISVC